MKKILLASGCSNTDENFFSEFHPDLDTSWPKWPELLAEKLNMDCVNLGKSGAGNEYIYTSLLEYITRNDASNIGLVIPAWSQNQRKDFQSGWQGRWTNDRIESKGDVFWWTRKSLDYYLSFQILCERYNINYLQVQMLSLYQDWLDGLRPRGMTHKEGNYTRYKYPGDVIKDNKKIIKIIDSYDGIINTRKFLGWPLSHEFSGYSLQKKIIQDRYNISNLDSHPNKEGQQAIMEFIYDRLD